MRYGTNNFVNKAAALRYYATQGYNETDVDNLIEEGNIIIGVKPEIDDDEYLTTDDGRYIINEG